MAVQHVRSASSTSAASATSVTAADLKTAAHLKTSIKEQLKLVRFGAPLKPNEQPTANAKNEWKAPNGDRLVRVQLSAPPPPGSADMMSQSAYVNPKTNQVYVGEFGGIAGVRMFHGPISLPTNAQFKGSRTFSAKDIAALTQAANGGSKPTTATPTREKMLAALGANEFHHLIKWSAKGPKAADVLKTVPLKKENHPDGYAWVGLVLKSDPNKVIIQRSGGLAGLTQYTQPLDVTRLPK